jgi:hypothetical protein
MPNFELTSEYPGPVPRAVCLVQSSDTRHYDDCDADTLSFVNRAKAIGGFRKLGKQIVENLTDTPRLRHKSRRNTKDETKR